LGYRTVYTIAGGYITALLSPDKPMKHVWILALLGLVGGILGVIGSWGKGLGPDWYPISLALLSIPSVWLGGKLQKKKVNPS
jgi:H+/Cl- antiporter ClcA